MRCTMEHNMSDTFTTQVYTHPMNNRSLLKGGNQQFGSRIFNRQGVLKNEVSVYR